MPRDTIELDRATVDQLLRVLVCVQHARAKYVSTGEDAYGLSTGHQVGHYELEPQVHAEAGRALQALRAARDAPLLKEQIDALAEAWGAPRRP